MIAQTLTSTISEHSSQRNIKATIKKGEEAASAQAAGEKADAKVAKVEDENYLNKKRTDGVCRQGFGV